MKYFVITILFLILQIMPMSYSLESSNNFFLFPDNNMVLTNRSINITGLANGSYENWRQDAENNSLSGSYNQTHFSQSQGIILDGGLYDDFHNDYLDTSKWVEDGPINSIIDNESFLVQGSYTTQNDEFNQLTSKQLFTNSISARINELNGNGHYLSGLGINDSNCSIIAGLAFNDETQFIFVESHLKGSDGTNYYFDPITPKNVTITLTWNLTSISIQIDYCLIIFNFSKGWIDESCYCNILTKTAYPGDSVYVSWDDVIGEKIFSGTFISNTYDIGYTNPKIYNITLDSTVTFNQSLSVTIRTSNDSESINFTPWVELINDNGFHAVWINRYLQYCITLYSINGVDSPILKSINILYDKKPVLKVEISIDDINIWERANGTEYWYIITQLHENSNVIWCKITYSGGDFELGSIKVYIDTTPPDGDIIINDNEPYTNNVMVNLELNASDIYGLDSMLISDDPNLLNGMWQPYCTSIPFRLNYEDGVKKVYVILRDNNGLESTIKNDSIILDTTPPLTKIIPMSTISMKTEFVVKWTGIDALSEIRWFDVQCRDGNKSWTNWLVKTNSTSSIFYGLDGHEYSFRVRGYDTANNIEEFPEVGSDSILIALPKPIIKITHPLNNSIIETPILIEGISTHQDANISITMVQIRVDNGTWQTAEGTTNWKWRFDIFKAGNGIHWIHARTFDGVSFSIEQIIKLVVRIPDTNPTLESFPISISIIFIGSISIFCFIVYHIKRRNIY